MTVELRPPSSPEPTKACCIVSGGLFACLLLLGMATVVTGCVLIGLTYYKQLPREHPLYFAKAYEREYLKAIGPIILVIGLVFILLPLAMCCLIVRGPRQNRYLLGEARYHSLALPLYDLPPGYEQVTKVDKQTTKGDAHISVITVLDYTEDRPPPYHEVTK